MCSADKPPAGRPGPPGKRVPADVADSDGEPTGGFVDGVPHEANDPRAVRTPVDFEPWRGSAPSGMLTVRL